MRRMENNVGRVWHDISLFSISISIALLSSYIRESWNGVLMVQTIFSNFFAFKHLTTVNLQHIRVTINKGNSYFTVRLYCRLWNLKLFCGELIDSALIKNAEAIAASMIKRCHVIHKYNDSLLLRDVNNDVADGKCTSASYF